MHLQIANKQEALERLKDESINVRILLEQLRGKLDSATDEVKRDIFQVFVEKIRVKSTEETGRVVPQVTIAYRFDKPGPITEYDVHGRRYASVAT